MLSKPRWLFLDLQYVCKFRRSVRIHNLARYFFVSRLEVSTHEYDCISTVVNGTHVAGHNGEHLALTYGVLSLRSGPKDGRAKVVLFETYCAHHMVVGRFVRCIKYSHAVRQL